MCPSPGRRPLESGVQSARAWQAVAWHFRHPFLRRHPRHAPRRQIISKRHGSRGPFPQDSPRHSRRLPPRGQHRPVQPPRRVPSGPSQALTTSSAKSNGRSCRPKRTTKTERSSWVSSRPNPRSSPVALVLILALVLTPRSPNPATLALVLVLAESSFLHLPCPCPCLSPSSPLSLPLPSLPCPRPALESALQGGEGRVRSGIDAAPLQWPRRASRLGSRLGTVLAASSDYHHYRRFRPPGARAGPSSTPSPPMMAPPMRAAAPQPVQATKAQQAA